MDKWRAIYLVICYIISMKKDINIRIDYETYKLLAKEAKKEDRTIKSMIRVIVKKYA